MKPQVPLRRPIFNIWLNSVLKDIEKSLPHACIVGTRLRSNSSLTLLCCLDVENASDLLLFLLVLADSASSFFLIHFLCQCLQRLVHLVQHAQLLVDLLLLCHVCYTCSTVSRAGSRNTFIIIYPHHGLIEFLI